MGISEKPGFFGAASRGEKVIHTDPKEAIADAKLFAYSTFVTRELAKALRSKKRIKEEGYANRPTLTNLVEEATAHMCTYASSREAYWLWRYATHLFKVIVVLEAKVEGSYPLVFSRFTDASVNNAVLTQDINGIWRYSASANHMAGSKELSKSDLEFCLESSSLEELLARVNEQETKVDPKYDATLNGGGLPPKLYPGERQVLELLRNYPEYSKPLLISQSIPVPTPPYGYYHQKNFYPLDPYQESRLKNEKNRDKCQLLQIATLSKTGKRFHDWTTDLHPYYRPTVIPKLK